MVNSLRTAVMVLILAAVGYGVYATLTTEPPIDPPGLESHDWSSAPAVELPGVGMGGAASLGAPTGAPDGGLAPPHGMGDAPHYAPPVSSWNDAPRYDGGPRYEEAPRYAAPSAPNDAPRYAPPDNPTGTAPPYGAPPAYDAPPYDAGAALPHDTRPSDPRYAADPSHHAPVAPLAEAPRYGGAPDSAGDRYAPTDGGYAPAAGDGHAPTDGRYDPSAENRYAPTDDRYDPAAENRYAPVDPRYAPADGGYTPSDSSGGSPAPYAAPYAAPYPADTSPEVTGSYGAAHEAAGAAPSSGTGMAESGPGGPGDFESAWQQVQWLLDQNRLVEAHMALSRWYFDPRVPQDRWPQIIALLDQLAGTVIYAVDQHLLEPAYEVQPGDTLDRVAQHYQVPWQLLAKVNGVADPARLPAGQRLKVLRGPFSGVVEVSNFEMTLWLNGLYAGRFLVGVGEDQTTPIGQFQVLSKVQNPTYYGPDGSVIDSGDPQNPLGEHWIDLGQHIGIHGTNDEQTVGRAESRGCIRLSNRDVVDVFDILSVGSTIVVRR